MQTTRQHKIARLIQKDLSDIFLRFARTLPGTLISVSEVRVSPDLAIAHVYLSIFPQSKVGDTLEAIQQEVEGLFQPVYREEGVILCCNEEGKLIGMQPNRRIPGDIICGPFFLVGDDGEGGFCSLTHQQIQRYKEYFREPEQFTGAEPELEPRMDFYWL